MKTLNLSFLNEQFDNDEMFISEILDIFVTAIGIFKFYVLRYI